MKWNQMLSYAFVLTVSWNGICEAVQTYRALQAKVYVTFLIRYNNIKNFYTKKSPPFSCYTEMKLIKTYNQFTAT